MPKTSIDGCFWYKIWVSVIYKPPANCEHDISPALLQTVYTGWVFRHFTVTNIFWAGYKTNILFLKIKSRTIKLYPKLSAQSGIIPWNNSSRNKKISTYLWMEINKHTGWTDHARDQSLYLYSTVLLGLQVRIAYPIS